MIPTRDTLGGPSLVPVTLALLVAQVVLFALGHYGAGFWVLLLALLGTWLFGGLLERRFGSVATLGSWLVGVGLASLVAGLLDGSGETFTFWPAGAAIVQGILATLLVPKGKILCLIPIPFAMGLYEVPVGAMVLVLGGLGAVAVAA